MGTGVLALPMVLAELGSKVALALRKMTQATVVGARPQPLSLSRLLRARHTHRKDITHCSAVYTL